ncbi:MAG: hypothetical protein BWY68_00849 [bacterium ADurb.Bin400]|nr:MAG: hypothetical protein BWY68_00849 [bacterium ADurb.Bin400]
MISYTNIRYKGGEQLPWSDQRSVSKALEDLLLYQLGFGGFVVEAGPTKLVTRTRVLGDLDVVTFEGSEKEMELLGNAAAVFMRLAEARRANPGTAERIWEALPKTKCGGVSPVIANMFVPMLLSNRLPKMAALIAVGVEPNDELLAVEDKDLVAAATLHWETGVPIEQILG